MLIPTCLIKFFELMLTTICLTLHHYSYDLTDIPTFMVCTGTYVGFIIVLSGEIVGEMLFAPLDLVQDLFFGLLGVVLFATSGSMVLAARFRPSLLPRTGDHTAAVMCGAISCGTALFLLFDLSLAYIDSEELEEDTREIVSAAPDAYVDAWWSATGAVLFGACGWLTLSWWHEVPSCTRRTIANSAAACSLANAALFAIDSLIAMCSAHREEEGSSQMPSKPMASV